MIEEVFKQAPFNVNTEVDADMYHEVRIHDYRSLEAKYKIACLACDVADQMEAKSKNLFEIELDLVEQVSKLNGQIDQLDKEVDEAENLAASQSSPNNKDKKNQKKKAEQASRLGNRRKELSTKLQRVSTEAQQAAEKRDNICSKLDAQKKAVYFVANSTRDVLREHAYYKVSVLEAWKVVNTADSEIAKEAFIFNEVDQAYDKAIEKGKDRLCLLQEQVFPILTPNWNRISINPRSHQRIFYTPHNKVGSHESNFFKWLFKDNTKEQIISLQGTNGFWKDLHLRTTPFEQKLDSIRAYKDVIKYERVCKQLKQIANNPAIWTHGKEPIKEQVLDFLDADHFIRSVFQQDQKICFDDLKADAPYPYPSRDTRCLEKPMTAILHKDTFTRNPHLAILLWFDLLFDDDSTMVEILEVIHSGFYGDINPELCAIGLKPLGDGCAINLYTRKDFMAEYRHLQPEPKRGKLGHFAFRPDLYKRLEDTDQSSVGVGQLGFVSRDCEQRGKLDPKETAVVLTRNMSTQNVPWVPMATTKEDLSRMVDDILGLTKQVCVLSELDNEVIPTDQLLGFGEDLLHHVHSHTDFLLKETQKVTEFSNSDSDERRSSSTDAVEVFKGVASSKDTPGTARVYNGQGVFGFQFQDTTQKIVFNHTFYSQVEQIQICHAKILMNSKSGYLTGKLENNLYTPMGDNEPKPIERPGHGEPARFDVGKAENFPVPEKKKAVEKRVREDDATTYKELLVGMEAKRYTKSQNKK